MAVTKKEKIVEKIVFLLLELETDQCEPERTYEMAANEAQDMAYRANRGWWEIGGRPYWNSRMSRIKRLWHRGRK